MNGHELSLLQAEEISRSLGHDPLLIALHDLSTTPNQHQVISQFVESSVSRAAARTEDYTAVDYRQVLRLLAEQMLENRQIELSWREVSGWEGLQEESLRLLSRLAHHGELIQLTGLSDDQRLSFRHDRVCDWLLADAVAALERRDLLKEEVVTDPYYAEVIGAALVWGQPKSSFLQRVASSNPLALFHALRLLGQVSTPQRAAILQAINDWLDNPATHDRSNLHLRWEALAMLAETDSPSVPTIVYKFRDQTVQAADSRGSVTEISLVELNSVFTPSQELEPRGETSKSSTQSSAMVARSYYNLRWLPQADRFGQRGQNRRFAADRPYCRL